jgi:hypothetical protein
MTLSGPQLAARRSRKSREPLAFRLQGGPPERGELVVDPARIPGVAPGDKFGRDHAVKRAVQRSGAHFHRVLRVLLDLLHDVVAVALSAEESQEDMEVSLSNE